MGKKLLRIISFIALLCLAFFLYNAYWAATIFHANLFSTIIKSQSTYLIVFALLAITSFYERLYLTILIITLGFIWSYFFDSIWFGEWLKIAFPKQLFTPSNLPAFLSGLSALLFIIIILFSAILFIKKIINRFRFHKRNI